MSASPAWSPTDEATGSLLDLIAADWRPFAEADRNTVAGAIRDDARFHGGEVSQNRVREALAALPVFSQPKPQRVGPVYRALCLSGYLEFSGWEVSEDRHGRNSGRPVRKYYWLGDGGSS
jgi:hypothetical protein